MTVSGVGVHSERDIDTDKVCLDKNLILCKSRSTYFTFHSPLYFHRPSILLWVGRKDALYDDSGDDGGVLLGFG